MLFWWKVAPVIRIGEVPNLTDTTEKDIKVNIS